MNTLLRNSPKAVVLMLCLLIGWGLADAAPSQDEARQVLAMQKQYWKERSESQWEAIYARQHPKLKEAVTLPLFINRRGLVGVDSPELLNRPNPGITILVPPNSDIVEQARDPLGIPVQPKYRFIANPWVKIDRVHYDKIWLSLDGRFARVEMTLDVTEQLPPQLFRMRIVLPHQRRYSDYFEKVDGEWKVALMEHKPGLSGAKMGLVFVPNQLEHFETMDWVEFDPARLESGDNLHD